MGQTERDRLESFYNGNEYDIITNPGGLAKGGHRTNFIPALQDTAEVWNDCAGFANRAEAAADQSEAWKLESAAVARTGVNTFTVAGYACNTYAFGRAVLLIQNSDATAHVIASSYNSGTGLTTVTLDLSVVDTGLVNVYFGQDPTNAPLSTGGGSAGSRSLTILQKTTFNGF